jgi:putative spermidine/putrescine transport system ATP-binding protein
MIPTGTDRGVAVRFADVSRHFGDVKAVDRISLDIFDGEFFSLLGPSGSGKTTCLRLIAGFEQPSSGSIQIYGKEVAGVPPYDRPVNTVFQDYALFPHMNVENNVAYGLMVKKVPKAERDRRVSDMLQLVRLPAVGSRKPSQLSGGQRQRIALARALINHPRVLLLDEPLGALDLKLRQEMQIELKAIQKRVGITFVFVTHDQEEALTMSDRIAVFNHGKIEQIGTPSEIYENPRTPFVAGFVGTTNIISDALAQRITGKPDLFSVRPEKIHMWALDDRPEGDVYHIPGTVRDVIYLGMYTRYLVELDDGGELNVVQQNLDSRSHDVQASRGMRVRLVFNRDSLSYLTATGG